MGSETCRKPDEHHTGCCPTCGSWCNWCPDTPSARGTDPALALVEQVKRLADAVEAVTPEDATGRRVINIVRVSP